MTYDNHLFMPGLGADRQDWLKKMPTTQEFDQMGRAPGRHRERGRTGQGESTFPNYIIYAYNT